MPKFIFSYQQPAGYMVRTDEETAAKWMAFFETIGDAIVDPGQPVFESTALGETGTAHQLGGYSVVEAASLAERSRWPSTAPPSPTAEGCRSASSPTCRPDHPRRN